MKRDVEDTDLIIRFSNKEAARHFAVWLCEAGEQDYWQWMEYRERKENGDITVKTFDYHGPNKTFLKDMTIRTIIGRLDEQNATL